MDLVERIIQAAQNDGSRFGSEVGFHDLSLALREAWAKLTSSQQSEVYQRLRRTPCLGYAIGDVIYHKNRPIMEGQDD